MKNKLILLVSMLLPLISGCGSQVSEEPTAEPTLEPTTIPTVEPTQDPTIEPTNYLETEYNLSFDSELSDLVLNYLLNGIGTDGDCFRWEEYNVMNVYEDCIENNQKWMEATLVDVKSVVGYIDDSTYEKIKNLDFLDIEYRTSGIIVVCPQYQKGIMENIITYDEDPLYVSYYREGSLPEKCDGKTIALYYIISTYEFENGEKLNVFDYRKPSYNSGFYMINKVQAYLDEFMIYPGIEMLNRPIHWMDFGIYSLSKSEIEKGFYVRSSNEKEMNFYSSIKNCIDEEEERNDGYYIKINYDRFIEFCGI